MSADWLAKQQAKRRLASEVREVAMARLTAEDCLEIVWAATALTYDGTLGLHDVLKKHGFDPGDMNPEDRKEALDRMRRFNWEAVKILEEETP